jgi:uncharacterized YigZ family protein
MIDIYHTIPAGCERTVKVQASRFIALAQPIVSQQEGLALLDRRRSEHFDATHHPYALRVGVEGEDWRASDDGEPSGTGGRPILSAIDHFGLTHVMVIVTRYFGGTKLGVGGLARAYGDAAREVLGAAGIEEKIITTTFAVFIPHPLVGQIIHATRQAGGRVLESTYSDEVRMSIEVRLSRKEELFERMVALTAGQVRRG